MANLSERTTSGESSWEVYVKTNPRWNTTTFQIERGEINVPVYASQSNIPTSYQQAQRVNPKYLLKQGDQIMIKENDFITVGRSRYARISHNQKEGYINITKIRKPTANADEIERRYLNLIQENIESLKRNASSGTINITVAGLPPIFGVSSIEKVTNYIHGRSTKSDFVFKNRAGRSLLHISHKAGQSPSDFGQYGGISESAGNIQDSALIYQDSEVQSYLNRLYELYSDAIGDRKIERNPFSSDGTLDRAVYRNINSPTLIGRSVFGPDYGGQRGPDNVDLLAQGHFVFDPVINTSGDVTYNLSFTGPSEVNGNISRFLDETSGYRAILLSTFRAGRPTKTTNGDIPAVRTGVYPKFYRQSAINIDTLLP